MDSTEKRSRRSSGGLAVQAALAALTAVSCVGEIGGVSEPPPLAAGACSPEMSWATTPTRRLTRWEYERTLAALLPPATLEEIQPALALIPIDRTADALDSLAQDVSANHVRAYFGVADAIGAWLEAASSDDRAALAPCLSSPDFDRECIAALCQDYGARVYRRPLSVEEVDRLVALYDELAPTGNAAAARAVITALFQSPDFVFQLEVQGEAEQDIVRLTGGEIANRLAYYLWGSPPDEELRDAASAGALEVPEELAAQVDRMLADPRTREHVRHFASQWLMLDRVDTVVDVPTYVREETEVEGLDEAAVAEIEQLFDYVVWDKAGSYKDLLATSDSFVESANLAAIYGVQPGTADSPHVVLEDPKRRGLLTRLAFLANAQGAGDPIHRGKRVRVQLLCDELSPPDPETLPPDALTAPPADPTKSTREQLTTKTSSGVCAACHQQINPLGFAMEDYDGLARWRSVEKIFDPEGTLLGQVPIDAAVDPALAGPGEPMVNGASELSLAVAESPKARACMAERWLEFARGSAATQDELSCGIEPLAQALASDQGGIAEMIVRYAELPSFRLKRIGE